ncbi:hypothetical protein [Streptomyces sp. NPDC050560]|uniref:hypothetical protein n=1 Tax=Streptomyces sp. NPDC050560 TaxID=3365630 RepID=UPI0037980C1C
MVARDAGRGHACIQQEPRGATRRVLDALEARGLVEAREHRAVRRELKDVARSQPVALAPRKVISRDRADDAGG